MVKHFEQIWEDSEKVAFDKLSDNPLKVNLACDLIGKGLEFIDSEESRQLSMSNDNRDKLRREMGNILFYLTFLSQHYNLNTWELLTEAMNNHKIEMMDEDEELGLNDRNR